MRWKHDPDETLDRFRQGIAELRHDDSVVGHLATQVECFLGLGGRLERVWLLITWADGRRERIEEDYPPWTSVEELRAGFLRRSVDGRQVQFEAVWLYSERATEAWHFYGIHEPVGHYF